MLLMAGCTALGLPQAKTFNERVAVAIGTVTTAREAATSLLTAGKITVTDAENVQKQADNAREGIIIATQIHETDPGGAETRLSTAITILQALQSYLDSRKHP